MYFVSFFCVDLNVLCMLWYILVLIWLMNTYLCLYLHSTIGGWQKKKMSNLILACMDMKWFQPFAKCATCWCCLIPVWCKKPEKMCLFGFWILSGHPSRTWIKLHKLEVQSGVGVVGLEAFTSSPQSYQHLKRKPRHQAGNAELGVSWGWGQNQLWLSSHFCLQAFLKGALPTE